MQLSCTYESVQALSVSGVGDIRTRNLAARSRASVGPGRSVQPSSLDRKGKLSRVGHVRASFRLWQDDFEPRSLAQLRVVHLVSAQWELQGTRRPGTQEASQTFTATDPILLRKDLLMQCLDMSTLSGSAS